MGPQGEPPAGVIRADERQRKGDTGRNTTGPDPATAVGVVGGDPGRHLRDAEEKWPKDCSATPVRPAGARRGLADEPAGGAHGGAAAQADGRADRGRRPPADAAHRQARLGRRAARTFQEFRATSRCSTRCWR